MLEADGVLALSVSCFYGYLVFMGVLRIDASDMSASERIALVVAHGRS
jgi:hypothetical protein